jgi:DNA polymerase IV
MTTSVGDAFASALVSRPRRSGAAARCLNARPDPRAPNWATPDCAGAAQPVDRLCEHTFVSGVTILHADVDSFFAAVEQRDDPRLRGRPVIVGAWVVLAASYEAKAHGVRTAMGVARARRLCPNAVVVEPRMSAYSEASKAVFQVFDDTSPLVEGLSIDEAFLDVRGVRRLSGRPVEIAARLRGEVRERVGLPITVGIARTKFLAKVASGVAKPDGLLVVPADRELAFLHPLPVGRLWGVGRVTEAKLHELGISTVGEVARLDEPTLVTLLGRASGRHLHALAHNRDPRPVRPGRRRGSIGAQRALGRSPKTLDEVDAALLGLVDRVTRRMRAAGRAGRTVVLRLRFDDFSRATRSQTLRRATANTQAILDTARELLAVATPLIERRGLTLVGIAVGNLEDGRAVQLSLPLDRHSSDALDAALDEVWSRFGSSAVTRAVLLRRGRGIVMPVLPD